MQKYREIPISLEEEKRIEYSILLKFSEICDAHQLRYSLAYGTLLGAVRHKGFIPWDDDIDVMMPRKDYMEFIRISQTELMDTSFRVASMHLDSSYFAPLSKMYDINTKVYQQYGQNEGKERGVYIDIFVLDNLPDMAQKEFYANAQKLRGKWALSVRKLFAKHKSRSAFRDMIGSIVAIPYKVRGFRYYRDLYDSYCSQYSAEECRDIAVVVYGEGLEKEKLDIGVFDCYSLVEFEGRQFKAVKNPEYYLKQMYGDYMVLPPESERVPKHPSVAVKISSVNK